MVQVQVPTRQLRSYTKYRRAHRLGRLTASLLQNRWIAWRRSVHRPPLALVLGPYKRFDFAGCQPLPRTGPRASVHSLLGRHMSRLEVFLPIQVRPGVTPLLNGLPVSVYTISDPAPHTSICSGVHMSRSILFTARQRCSLLTVRVAIAPLLICVPIDR